MKSLITRIWVVGIALFLFTACEDEPALSVLEKVEFPTSPAASTDAIVITEENKIETLIQISWPAVDFPVDAPVSYTLYFDIPGDTSGANGWENAVQKIVGDDVLSASFSGEELNEIALEIGREPGIQGAVVARVKATMDRDIYSSALALKVTPIEIPEVIDYPSLWIAGDFQGWNIGVNPARISSVKDDGVYEGYIYIPAGGTNEFKVYAQPDWGPMSYGNAGEDSVKVANFAGANFVAPSDGYYLLSINLNTWKYLLIKIDSWGLIGAATPSGWDASTPMTYNIETQVWTVTAAIKAGEGNSFKIRANNAWQLDFGKEEGKLAYANHPWLPYVEQSHFSVSSSGNYTVTLDLHIPGNYSYKIKKD